MSKNKLWGLLLLLASTGLTGPMGCRDEAATKEGLTVVATTGMIADMAEEIAGEHAVVSCLMGPGVDPHLYRASEGDVRRLSGADLILYNGLALEGKMAEIFTKLGRSRPVVAVASGVPDELLLHPAGLEGHPDPHVWFDPDLWRRTLASIVEALTRLAPEHAVAFKKNATDLKARLIALDKDAQRRFEEIPASRRVLVTAHDAFRYLGRRYQVEVVGLQGISTAAEASIQDVRRVTDLLVSRKIKAVFVESSVPQRNLKAVVEACKERGHEVVVGGELFSDALGAAGTPEGTYEGMVRHNVATIVEALR